MLFRSYRVGNTLYLKTETKPRPIVRFDSHSFSMMGMYEPIPISEYLTELFPCVTKNELRIDLSLNEYILLIPQLDSKGYYPVLIKSPEYQNEDLNTYHLRMITYVHELEDLFKVLTGREIYDNK